MTLCENGHEVRAGAAFCGRCGSPVLDTSHGAEAEAATAQERELPVADAGREASAGSATEAGPEEPVWSFGGAAPSEPDDPEREDTGPSRQGWFSEPRGFWLFWGGVVAAVVLVIVGATALSGGGGSREDSVTASRPTTTTTIEPPSASDVCFDDLAAIIEYAWRPGSTAQSAQLDIYSVYGSTDVRTQFVYLAYVTFQGDVYQVGTVEASFALWDSVREWCDLNGREFYDVRSD